MHKAVKVKPQDDYTIKVSFSDGKVVLYDIKPLFAIVPAFRILQKDEGMFQSVKVSVDGSMISWNASLNLDADNVWENGIFIEYERKPDSRRLLAYAIQLARSQEGITQKELSEKTGICQADISKLERGLGNPAISTLERLAEGLGKELFIELREPAKNQIGENASEEGKKMVNKDDMNEIYRHKTLEERAAEYGGQLNLAGEYDWGEPVGREVW